MMRALFLPRYGRLAGSSRYMTYDYLRYFEAAGIRCDVVPFLDNDYLRRSAGLAGWENAGGQLLITLLRSAARRMRWLLSSSQYDIVILEKDVIPYFPYGLETILFSLNRRVVVMYDERTDAYYRAHPLSWVNWVTRGKIERIIRRASHVVVWNRNLLELFLPLNRAVTLLHTGIDLERYRCKKSYECTGRPFRVGWIGSPTGFDYLRDLAQVWVQLSRLHDVEMYVVSSVPFSLPGVKVVNRTWSVETEVDDLTAMDLGVMPLQDDEWSVGKSGCKMFQYMGVGLPVVSSPVGACAEVLGSGENGFVARTAEEWLEKLDLLIRDQDRRTRLGVAGRRYVEINNSQAANAARLVDLIRRVACPARK